MDPIDLEQAILNSKRQLLEIFDGITDPIIMIGRDFKVLRLNRAALSLLDGHKSFSNCIGRYCYEVLHERDKLCDKCPVEEVFTSGKPILEPRLVERVKDNINMTFDVSVFPLRDINGKVYAAAKYFKDVTHTIELEAELYEAERSRLLGSIAVGLAHEIRNPLAVISSTAQFIRSEFPDDPEVFVGMETIIRNTDQANSVIADLLNFARPKDTTVESVDFDEVLETGIRVLKKQFEPRKIKVTKKIEKDLPKLNINRQNFIQAYVNLLMHAADTMPDGGNIHIEAEALKTDESVQVTIRDSGHGFSPEVARRLFKPFLRSKGGAAGLRLPIAEDIIKTHGGSVDFQSKEGVGSTTVIKLPVV